MLKIKVTQSGMKPKEFDNLIMKNVNVISAAADDLASQAVVTMANIILSSTKRQPSTGRLANSIVKNTTTTDVMSVYGIGEISKLPPYWYVINYGCKDSGVPFIPGGGATIRGSFNGEPTDSNYRGIPGGAGERFGKDGRMNNAVKATIPVEPMNYIEKTQAWFDMSWKMYIQSRVSMS